MEIRTQSSKKEHHPARAGTGTSGAGPQLPEDGAAKPILTPFSQCGHGDSGIAEGDWKWEAAITVSARAVGVTRKSGGHGLSSHPCHAVFLCGSLMEGSTSEQRRSVVCGDPVPAP